MLLEILTGVIGFFLLIFKIYTWRYDYWKKQGIPYLEGQFPFGNLKDLILMRKSMGDAYNEMYWKFKDEPFFGFFKLWKPSLMVRDPELVQQVLADKFTSFDGNDYYVDPQVDPSLGLNPFNCRGELWKHTRGMLTPSLTGLKIKLMLPNIVTISNEMIAYIKENQSEFFETLDLGRKYTTDVVAASAYSLKINSFKDPNSEFRNMADNLFDGSIRGNAATLFAFYAPQLGGLLKWKILTDEVTDYFERIIKDAAELRMKNETVADDLLQTLINANLEAAKNNKGPVYNYKEIAGHCMTFSLDGFETGAMLVSYLLYELSMNPEIQAKLRDEITKKIGDIDKIDYSTIHSIEYLDHTIYECLRKHSPGTAMARKCNKTARLECRGKEVVIEPGISVTIPLLTIMNDPLNFPDPERFRPERFDEKEKRHHPYAHIPFGGGPRSCPGKQFALTMVKMAVISMITNFNIIPKDKTLTKIEEDPMNSFFHSSKCPIYVKFVNIEEFDT